MYVCFLVQIVDEAPDPSGPFSDFSSIQSVIITGYIDTPRSDQGMISYSTDLYYHFSCRYPLEYLINNTQIVAWVIRNAYIIQKGHCSHFLEQISFIFSIFSVMFSSSVSVATSENNGTFIDTLMMRVFNVGTVWDLARLDKH